MNFYQVKAMSMLEFLSLIVIITCVIQPMQVCARRGNYYQEDDWKRSNRKIAFYMGCHIKDRFRYDSDMLQPPCNITTEIPTSHGSVERLTCNVDKPPFSNLLSLHYEISALANPNVAILYGTGKSWAKIRIVRMRECRYRDVFIDVDPVKYNDFGTVGVNVTLNDRDDTFSVFYEDKRECRNGVCVDTYDFSGRLLEGPYNVSRPIRNQNIDKITYVFGEQYGGNIGLTYDYESIKLVSYRGQEPSKILFKLPRHNVTVLSISTTNKLFGLCYKWNGYQRAACLQYDNKGRQKMNSTFYYPRGWTSMRVKNRYEGNFTALATNCTVDDCEAERDIKQVHIWDTKIKYGTPPGFIPLFCRSRVGDKSKIEISFDYAIYLNCKPSMRGSSYSFMFKSWCSEFIRCTPVIL